MNQYDQLVWYQNLTEVFNPLRFHLHELIEALETINSLREYVGEPPTYLTKIEKAKEALNAAEEFSTRPLL